MNPIWKLVILVAFVSFIGYVLEESIELSTLNNAESPGELLEIISDLFAVFVAISIFTITWYAYNKSRDNHSLFLGSAFLIIGLLILFHLLSYPFMPDFINSNSSHKAGIFFFESRFILAVSLISSVYIHNDSLPKLINKKVMVLSVIVILSVFLSSVFVHDNMFFLGFTLDNYSIPAVMLLFITTIIILVAGYLYAKRARETGQRNLQYLTYGSVIIIFSNMVYLYSEFSGHFLIIASFFYFYLGLYRSSIELPYEKLAIAEENLRIRAENKYLNIFDNANDAIITTDLEDKVTSWNRSAENLFGWNAHEVMEKKLSSLIVPLNLQIYREDLIRNTINGKSASGVETIYMRKDGTRIFVNLTTSQLLDLNQNLAGLSFIVRDITERKKAEDLLNKSKEFAETVINSMNDAIAIIDINNFRITDVNSVFLEIYGMKKEELMGKTCYEITHKRSSPCTSPDDICPLINTLNSGKYSEAEHVHYIRGGKKQYVEVSTSPIKDKTGKVVNVIYVSRDITERKLAEKQIEISLKEKETLLKEIHHRVKNNMQIVSSLLDCHAHYIKDKNVIDIFTESQNRITSMSLVHEKLYQSKDLAKIDFNDYINDLAANLFQSYVVNSDKITLNIKIENIQLDIDSAIPCGLIINELVTNSLKYAFPGGKKGEVRIALRKMDEEMFELVIGDNGIGLPRDLDFRKTSSLGLHLVTILAENQLHGEINVNTDTGTEFQIKFGGIK
ncbi:MAG: PAS domain S-box protein [Candidatus Methanoperedens sp.]|nr:PAS domain S-box protein [Candidatus Methanoperedens sp.]